MASRCPMCDREQLVKGILRTQGLINAETGQVGTRQSGRFEIDTEGWLAYGFATREVKPFVPTRQLHAARVCN
jgi:hypothetical protein